MQLHMPTTTRFVSEGSGAVQAHGSGRGVGIFIRHLGGFFGWVGGRMGGRMSGWIDRRMSEWIGGRMSEWIGG